MKDYARLFKSLIETSGKDNKLYTLAIHWIANVHNTKVGASDHAEHVKFTKHATVLSNAIRSNSVKRGSNEEFILQSLLIRTPFLDATGTAQLACELDIEQPDALAMLDLFTEKLERVQIV